MAITKIKVSPELKIYRKAWKLYQAGLIDKKQLTLMLDKVVHYN